MRLKPAGLRFDREAWLRARLNTFLAIEFKLPERDYYANLSFESLLSLKSLVSDINNIITLKASRAFIDWIAVRLGLDDTTKSRMTNDVLSKKPSSNGFDIVDAPTHVVAEVKCNVPIKCGSKYGSAQRSGIEKDVIGLLQGKSKAPLDPKDYRKFLVLPDLPQVRAATDHLAKFSKTCAGKITFASENDNFETRDLVYVVYVELRGIPPSQSDATLGPRERNMPY
jgi:hypothetical protein